MARLFDETRPGHDADEMTVLQHGESVVFGIEQGLLGRIEQFIMGKVQGVLIHDLFDGDRQPQHADRFGSTTIVSKPVKLEGKKYTFTIALNYLYYKDTNKEDYDLNFLISGPKEYDIPVDSPVTFELADGSMMNLKQEQDDKDAVHCYPTIDQVKTLLRGVRSLTVDTADGTIKEVFAENEFAKILDLQYNSLQVVSPL